MFLIWPEYIKLCSVYFNLVSNQYSDDKLERCQLLISSALFWRRSASPSLRLVSLFWFACHLNHNSISTGSARESTPLQAGSNTVVDCIDWAWEQQSLYLWPSDFRPVCVPIGSLQRLPGRLRPQQFEDYQANHPCTLHHDQTQIGIKSISFQATSFRCKQNWQFTLWPMEITRQIKKKV